ncbi:hypothetical protein ERX46_10930 [Brumimicrobium glaciale]|uniref:Signal transduction histidine kinase internal region domain-containing protein n=1 Tax=Brumimicrobium glaciale TaxID=200475 RepID=A0A4Q4KL37_9FLAO|nr:histidine kinase [Brumimicrobium glaciale]RYM33447.1 hypothetical protein ERX46_10930 [Brumimicrobium glaciale]
MLGAEELMGFDIYDLHQDSQLNYWITSDNGLYKFDGYEIKNIECEKMIDNSLFNLIEDKQGNIYCHNLNGQIFQVKNDTCKVYFTIPDSLIKNNISIKFDDQERLIIFSKKIYQLSNEKEILTLYDKELDHNHSAYKTLTDSLLFYNTLENEFIQISNGQLTTRSLEIDFKVIFPNFMEIENKLIGFNRNTLEIIKKLSDSSSIELPNMPSSRSDFRIYTDNKSIWVANLTGGAYFYKDTGHFTLPSNLVFEKNIISCFLSDHEGNSLLGTFGKGIIVVPNTGFQDIQFDFTNSEIVKVAKMKNESLFFGTQAGEIIKIDSLGKTIKIVEKSNKRIELLKSIPELNALFFNGKNDNLLSYSNNKNLASIPGSVKDVCYFENHKYLTVSNSYLYWLDSNNVKIKKSRSSNFRSYSIGYDSLSKSIYQGTAVGLRIFGLKNDRLFLLNGKDVLADDIKFSDGKIYVATKRHGLLLFENDSLIEIWSTSTGLMSNKIKLIKFYEDDIFLATDNGINRITKSGELVQSINYTNGLNAKNILDFELSRGMLWIVTNKGVQNILLSEIRNDVYTPFLELTSIKVNDKTIDTAKHNFNYENNKFVFEIASKTLKYRNDIHYEFQLVGVDEEWVTSTYENNVFEYKSLPPGAYTFKVRSVYDSNYSDVIAYDFKIQKPFWLKTSFFILAAIFFLLIVFIVLYFQIRKQKNKLLIENKFNKTQLTALKSQMNPHFIFNSLNSIQDLILQQDKENAYNYISKFALLVRKILNHSDREFIDFEEEVDVLSVYLSLEELRFKNDFSFQIKTNGIKDIEIPPMLIQPFVENALKHGLLHKKGAKILGIEFIFKNETLICKIEDNGIGRKKSNEIKQRQHKLHDSFSIKSINTRLEILKELYGKDVGVDFEDLTDGDLATGTIVILKIPFKRRF